MCRPATCRTCGKATYAGCGQHVEQVLGNVPKAQRCSCRGGAAITRATSGASAKSAADGAESKLAENSARNSWMSKFFGR